MITVVMTCHGKRDILMIMVMMCHCKRGLLMITIGPM